MEYSVYFNNKNIELKQYSFDIEEKIKSSIGDTRAQYNFLNEVCGSNVVREIVGEYKNCDPNVLGILYADVISAYRTPLAERNAKEVAEKIDDLNIEKLSKLSDILDKVNEKC